MCKEKSWHFVCIQRLLQCPGQGIMLTRMVAVKEERSGHAGVNLGILQDMGRVNESWNLAWQIQFSSVPLRAVVTHFCPELEEDSECQYIQ